MVFTSKVSSGKKLKQQEGETDSKQKDKRTQTPEYISGCLSWWLLEAEGCQCGACGEGRRPKAEEKFAKIPSVSLINYDKSLVEVGNNTSRC